ncbi:MAG: hypothetical protein HY854_09195 [Burkholderiales bacterium]|nr:hypothetical protein [Burkholderiales bacterium]
MMSFRLLGACALALALSACGGGRADHPLLSAPYGSAGDLQPSTRSFAAARMLQPSVRSAAAIEPEPLSIEQVFDWAESRFADLFPTAEETKVLGPYEYRYYPSNNLYLGVSEGKIYLLGATHTGGNIVHVANVADFASRIASCDQGIKADAKGTAILPVGAFEAEPPVSVDEDNGSIAALYPDQDTTTDAFYPNLPCEPSIGGTLPAEEPAPAGADEAEQALAQYETDKWGPDAIAQLAAMPHPTLPAFASFTQSGCSIRTEGTAGSPGTIKPVDCNDSSLLDANMPFEGRDIIYVHGLDTSHLHGRIADPTGPASRTWPADSAEFLGAGGFFRTSAETYWTPHLVEHMSSPLAGSPGDPWPGAGWQWGPGDAVPVYVPKSNRYLLVAWNTSQRLAYAQHTLLDQVRRAMVSNLNVVTPPGFPAGHVRPFCFNGCIVIGHSTGPLVTSSAFGRAHAGDFGPGGVQVVSKMVAHVALNGATSGSRVATAGLLVASAGAPLGAASNVICDVVDALLGTTNSCNADLSFLLTSVLLDLMPAVAQGVWGIAINNSPVPTVTVAGGHALGNQAAGLTKLLLPGLDDGVVTMNSACGNSNPVFPLVLPPSGFTVSQPVKAFEFSDWLPRLVRGTKMWLSHKDLKALAPFSFFSGGCTPYLSPQGMVMPVANAFPGTTLDAHARYRNHYSLLQGVAEHSYDGGASAMPALWPSYTGLAASVLRQYSPLNAIGTTAVSGINVEESRAVTDPAIYAIALDAHGTRLAKPFDMRQVVRGKRISFHMPFNIGNCTKKSTLKYYCTRWIWKRTYHLADKWEQKQSSHYVYEFVARR